LERTLVIIKPDGVQRGLVGEIVSRIEQRGLRLIGMRFMQVSTSLAEEHYAIHKGKPFYTGLIKYITSAPVVVMAWEGRKAIEAIRQLMGATNPTEAAPGTIRADFGIDIGRNLTHGSDSPENGLAEVGLWFSEEELVAWERIGEEWVYE